MSSINRKPHCLKREKTLVIPRHVIFFDCETNQLEDDLGNITQTLKMGWVCYYMRAYDRHLDKFEWLYFETALEFWTFVFRHTQKKRKLWIISHNLNFDFTIVEGWKYLNQACFKLKFFHNSGTTSIISVRSKDGSILFVDFMNWFKESLAKIGDRLGIPKLNIDFEKADDSFLSTYCKRDVEILIAGFQDFAKFLEGNHISRLCYTIASTAMAAYLFGFYDYRIYIHNNKEAIDLERESYRGGRCECFFLGDRSNGPYYVLDVNGLYSTIMLQFKFPNAYRKIVHNITLRSLRTHLKRDAVIAKVLIHTDEPAYAVKRDRTIFPVGKFWACLTTPELFYALENNHIVEIAEAVIYRQAPIFKRYVQYIYDLRLEFKAAGVGSYVEICKLLLNSLYGKFGQKAEVWEKIGSCPGERDRVEICFTTGSGHVRQIRYLLGEIWELTGYEECFNSFPAIASHVAAYARMYLYKLMKIAESGNYYYCDTDSLIVNEAGFHNLKSYLDDSRLGYLKIQEVTSKLTIRGLKDYCTNNKDVIKGIRRNAVKVSDGVYTQQQWPSLKGLLRKNSTDSYKVKQITKTLTRKYTKGIVTRSGWIHPIDLDESHLLDPRLF